MQHLLHLNLSHYIKKSVAYFWQFLDIINNQKKGAFHGRAAAAEPRGLFWALEERFVQRDLHASMLN